MSRSLNALVLICLVLLGGCARRQITEPAGPAPTAAATAPAPVREPVPVAPPAKKPALPFLAVSSPAETPAPERKPPSLPEQTAAEIRGRYAYSLVGSDILVVKRTDIKAPAAALFEQAIALNRLRTTLIARNGIPSEVTHNVRLKDGQATIPFGRRIAPEKAAEAIVTALSVEGVQNVRAVF